jgi:hypothetical protein
MMFKCCGAFWTVSLSTPDRDNAALPLRPNTQQGRHVVVVLSLHLTLFFNFMCCGEATFFYYLVLIMLFFFLLKNVVFWISPKFMLDSSPQQQLTSDCNAPAMFKQDIEGRRPITVGIQCSNDLKVSSDNPKLFYLMCSPINLNVGVFVSTHVNFDHVMITSDLAKIISTKNIIHILPDN